jgi:MFS family permease
MERSQPRITIRSIINDKSDIRYVRRLLICFLVYSFQQLTGVNAVIFYANIVLEQNIGLSHETSALVSGFLQLSFFVGTCAPIYLLDRVGRKPILLFGSIVLTICLVLFVVGITIDTSSSANLALAMLVAFQLFFGLSWNSTPWVYAPEMTPLAIRHVGSAIGVFAEWLWNYVVVAMMPAAVENTGWKIYLFFILSTVLSIPVVWLLFPETAGRSLEDIDHIFMQAVPDPEEGKGRPGHQHVEYSNEHRPGQEVGENNEGCGLRP